MKTILITGMSGTGKSTAIRVLSQQGHEAVETDDCGWCEPEDGDWSSPDSDWVWDEARIARLLSTPRDRHLFVSGCRPNQGAFYDRFDHIVLLSAPLEVMLARVSARPSNPFGSTASERAKIAADKEAIEPLLRAGADLEIDTGVLSPDDVVARIVALL